MSGSIRADYYSQTQKMPDIYSDFLDDFSSHPITGDIARLRNEQSVKQSLRNLVLTNYGERFFQPNIGCNVMRSLFEIIDLFTIHEIQYHVKQTIENSEPRVNLLQVIVTPNDVNNQITISIIFSLINSTAIQSLDLILKRVR